MQVYSLMPSAMAIVNDAVPYLYKGAKDVFVRATVRDILFDGILITCHDPEVEFVCGAMKSMLPPTMEFVNNGSDFKFSMFGYVCFVLIYDQFWELKDLVCSFIVAHFR